MSAGHPVADAAALRTAGQASDDFSLVLGGPLYQLLRRARLCDDVLAMQRRRLIVLGGLTWLPLLILAAAGGQLVDGVAVPFLYDVEVHVRFLLALPLLVVAELAFLRPRDRLAAEGLDDVRALVCYEDA